MVGVNEGVAAKVVVIGGGPAGLVCAIALQTAGVDVLLVAPRPPKDHRTTALLAGSVTALTTLGVWEHCRAHAAPLVSIRIVDSTRRLVRAPEVMFRAEEIGLDAFGCNIENRHLVAALSARAAALNVARIDAAADAVTSGSDEVTVSVGDSTVHAQLAIGADGAHSLCRAAAGIGTNRHVYPQTALTLNLAHDRPHQSGATEFHTEHGPLTLVPLPGARSSVVCVAAPADADALSRMNDHELSAEIERRAHSRARALRWLARPRMWCRRSARKDSIWDFATPQPWPKSSPTHGGKARISVQPQYWRATIAPAAPTRPAGASRSTSSTEACLRTFYQCKACVVFHCFWSIVSDRCVAR